MATLAEPTTWQWWRPPGTDPDRSEENSYLQVRISADPDWRAIAVTCPDSWAVWLADEFVDAGRIPTIGDHWYHDVVELPERAGPAELTLVLLNPAACTFRCDPHPWRVSIAVRVGDSWQPLGPDRVRVGPDPCYVSGPAVEFVSPQLGRSFRCDLRAPVPDLAPAVPTDPPVDLPRPRPRPMALGETTAQLTAIGEVTDVPPSGTPAEQMQAASLRTRSVTPTSELTVAVDPRADAAVVFADLGEVVAGHVELELECAAPVRVDLGSRNFAARIEFPAGRTRFTHRLQRIAGRHLQLHLVTEAPEVRIGRILVHRRGFPLPPYEGQTSDPQLRAIAEACDRTLRLCAQEHYEDTPWREQSLYGLDARVQAAVGLAAYGQTRLPRFSQELLGANRRPDGLLRMTSPSAIDRTIPSFALHWIASIHEVFAVAPDLDHLARCWPSVESVLELFVSWQVDGLPLVRPAEDLWHFYDWTPTLSDQLEICDEGRWDAPLALLLANAADHAGQFADALGRTDGDRWRRVAAEVDQAAAERFGAEDGLVTYACPCHGRGYPPAPQQYDSFTVALAALTPREPWRGRADRLRGLLADPARDRGTLVQSYFRHRALLADPDHTDLVRAEILERWAPQLLPGATTWEVDEGAAAFDRAGSLSHAWAAAPLAVLPLL